VKFQCNLSELQSAVNIVQKAAMNNSPMTALGCVNMSLNKDTLTLMCNNLEICIMSSISVLNLENVNFEFLLNCKLFGDIVRKLNGDYVFFKLSENRDKLQLKAENALFNISSVNQEEFPRAARIVPETEFEIGQNHLKELIKKTSFCAGNLDNKPILTGCFLERINNVETNEISMVALDGSRLAKKVIKVDEKNPELSVVIPSKSLNELLKILRDTDDKLKILVSKSGIEFLVDNIVFISRIFNSQYVDYRKITFNCDFKYSIIVNTNDLLNAVERVSILLFSETSKKPIILDITNDKIVMSCNTSFGSSSDEVVLESIKDLNIDLNIAFNHKFLIEALKNVTEDKCILKFSNNISPMLIEPIESSDFVFAISPVRIR